LRSLSFAGFLKMAEIQLSDRNSGELVTASRLARELKITDKYVYERRSKGYYKEGVHYITNKSGKQFKFVLKACLDREIEVAQKPRKALVNRPKAVSLEAVKVDIPESLLKKLRLKAPANSSQKNAAILSICKLVFGRGDKPSENYWNQTIDYLDHYHPGWRGYEVRYPDGRVC
jgi:hypothetical protein